MKRSVAGPKWDSLWNKRGGERWRGEAYKRGRERDRERVRGGMGRGGDKFCQTHERYSSWPLAKAPEAVRSYMFARSREDSNSSSYMLQRQRPNVGQLSSISHRGSFAIASAISILPNLLFRNFRSNFHFCEFVFSSKLKFYSFFFFFYSRSSK